MISGIDKVGVCSPTTPDQAHRLLVDLRAMPRCVIASALLLLPLLTTAQLGPEHRFIHPITGSALCVHDMDGDGDGDIVREAGGRFQLIEQVAAGDYRTTTDLGPVGTVDRVRVGDVDGDGIEDLVFNDRSNGSIGWVRIFGGGSYAPVASLINGLADPYDVPLADVDGDLDPDLIHLAGSGTSTLAWSQNLGGGAFGAGGVIFSGSLAGAVLDVVNGFDVADIDMDGDPDVAMVLPSLCWYQNNGSGVFTLNALAGGADCSDLVMADADGDNDADLLLAWFDGVIGGDILVSLNNGSGVFGPAGSALPFPVYDTYLTGLTAFDADGDGDMDIMTQTDGDFATSNTLLYMSNTGIGSFTFGLGVLWSDNLRPWTMGNLDGDPLLDVVCYTNDALVVRSGSGALARINSIAPSSITPFDLDNDGSADAAVSQHAIYSPLAEGPRPWGLAFHDNLGGGDMREMPDAPVPETLSTLRTVPGDLDGDGDLDLLAVWAEPLAGTGRRLFTLMNNGTAMDSIQAVGNVFWNMLPGLPHVPILRDLDLDGDTDVFRYTWSDITYCLNNGSGSFGPQQNHYIGNTWIPTAVTLADMDGDSDPDYVWTHGSYPIIGPDSIFWCENDGFGVPGPSQFAGLAPLGVFPDIDPLEITSPVLRTIDLDGDGWEDLVLFHGDSIGVVRNSGSGSFLPGQALPADSTRAMDIGDLDLDGLPDIVALRPNGDILFWSNTGGVTFGASYMIATAADQSGTDDIRLADMDGDGIRDVVTCSANGAAAWLGNSGLSVGNGHGIQRPHATLAVYPNPTSGGVQLTFDRPADEDTRIEVLDASGRILRAMRGNGTRELVIERGVLAAGVYTLRVAHVGLRPVAERMLLE